MTKLTLLDSQGHTLHVDDYVVFLAPSARRLDAGYVVGETAKSIRILSDRSESATSKFQQCVTVLTRLPELVHISSQSLLELTTQKDHSPVAHGVDYFIKRVSLQNTLSEWERNATDYWIKFYNEQRARYPQYYNSRDFDADVRTQVDESIKYVEFGWRLAERKS